MTAAMAVAAGDHFLVLGNAGDLAEAWQGVVFAEDGDDRPAFAGLAHHRGGDAREILLHPEAETFQHLGVLSHRAIFGVGDLGDFPDPVGERLEFRPVVVDKLPDLV
jgi:hypothetical protein